MTNRGRTKFPVLASLATDPEIYSVSQLLEVAVTRVNGIERILAPALTIIGKDNWTGFDLTWGRVLRAAGLPFRREACARIAGRRRFSPSRWLAGLAGLRRG